MQPDAILGALEKINDRLGSVEQNLQQLTDRVVTLPTRDELDARLAPLVTRSEFDARLDLLRADVEERVAPLPTREELKQEHLETRRHIDARFDEVRARFNVLADGYEHLSDKLDKVHEDLKKDIAGVDRRVMKLEGHTGLIGGQH